MSTVEETGQKSLSAECGFELDQLGTQLHAHLGSKLAVAAANVVWEKTQADRGTDAYAHMGASNERHNKFIDSLELEKDHVLGDMIAKALDAASSHGDDETGVMIAALQTVNETLRELDTTGSFGSYVGATRANEIVFVLVEAARARQRKKSDVVDVESEPTQSDRADVLLNESKARLEKYAS